jgi:hypothetical protein
MTSTGYLTLGYSVALGLLWGYGALLWWQLRALRQRGSRP